MKASETSTPSAPEIHDEQDVAPLERHFRELVNDLDAIVWEADAATGRYTFVNRRAEQILGYPVEQWLSVPDFWLELLHPDDRPFVITGRHTALNTGHSNMEYRVVAANGATVWVRAPFHVVRDSSGQPRRLRGLMLDITERRQHHEAALRLAAIVESSEDAIIGKDLNGVITTWNAGAERMYGYRAEEAIGRPITMLSPPERLNEVAQIMRWVIAGDHISHFETQRLRKDGVLIDVALTISPIRNPEGEVIGASTIAREITELRRAEHTLQLTEKLAATGRLAASIAHEINNPMASVTNLMYLLEHHPTLDETARQYVVLANEELQRVTHIVRQMLGFYRESDTPLAISPKDVLENVLLLYAGKMRNAGIRVDRQYVYAGMVQAYPGELRQVFSNIVVNAIEALGHGGHLSIRVQRARDWGNSARMGVRVLVADDGPGISPRHRRRVFEPFFTTKGERGTGLGLWVSEGIIRKHGGSIRVRSCERGPRRGTSFSIFLPDQPEWRVEERHGFRAA